MEITQALIPGRSRFEFRLCHLPTDLVTPGKPFSLWKIPAARTQESFKISLRIFFKNLDQPGYIFQINGKRQPDKERQLHGTWKFNVSDSQVWPESIGSINSCHLMAKSSWKWVIHLRPSPRGQLQIPSMVALSNGLIYSQGTDSKDRRGHGGCTPFSKLPDS